MCHNQKDQNNWQSGLLAGRHSHLQGNLLTTPAGRALGFCGAARTIFAPAYRHNAPITRKTIPVTPNVLSRLTPVEILCVNMYRITVYEFAFFWFIGLLPRHGFCSL
ncbi:MAG: hypothetical protein GVY16_04875 [Planctomycetes bacterium]|nr:hypothetical protein [Planctomycetota bacterium]